MPENARNKIKPNIAKQITKIPSKTIRNSQIVEVDYTFLFAYNLTFERTRRMLDTNHKIPEKMITELKCNNGFFDAPEFAFRCRK